MLLCIVYAMLLVNTLDMKIKACNTLNGMFVDTVKDTGVCGSYTSTVYRVMRCENSKVASCPSKREGYCTVPFVLWV